MLSKATLLACGCAASVSAIPVARAQSATEISAELQGQEFRIRRKHAARQYADRHQTQELDCQGDGVREQDVKAREGGGRKQRCPINVPRKKPARYEFFDEYNEKTARGALVVSKGTLCLPR